MYFYYIIEEFNIIKWIIIYIYSLKELFSVSLSISVFYINNKNNSY